jgi:adenylate cyclase
MGGVLEALNRGLAADLAKPIDIGIGIHTGPAILGRIGVSNARGATQRITALGDTVNTASRLEQACKALRCQLVVSQGTLDAAGLEPGGARRAHIAVKGRSEKVQVAAFKRALDLVLPEAVAAAPKTSDP